MPMVYDLQLATAGTTSTHGSANTENSVYFVKAGVRNVALFSMYAAGRGAALTSITGIGIRIAKFATAGTSGTAITPAPRDPGMQVAKCTSASGHTVGTGTRIQQGYFGFGAAGPGVWVAPNPDAVIALEGSATNGIDVQSVSAGTNMTFEWSAEIQE